MTDWRRVINKIKAARKYAADALESLECDDPRNSDHDHYLITHLGEALSALRDCENAATCARERVEKIELGGDSDE